MYQYLFFTFSLSGLSGGQQGRRPRSPSPDLRGHRSPESSVRSCELEGKNMSHLAVLQLHVLEAPRPQRTLLEMASVADPLHVPHTGPDQFVCRCIDSTTEHAQRAASDPHRPRGLAQQPAHERDCRRGMREQHSTRVFPGVRQLRERGVQGVTSACVHTVDVLACARRVEHRRPSGGSDLGKECLQELRRTRAWMQTCARHNGRVPLADAYSPPVSAILRGCCGGRVHRIRQIWAR
jgi:hypothetical protein